MAVFVAGDDPVRADGFDAAAVVVISTEDAAGVAVKDVAAGKG
ncbi:hypothetical protein ACWEAF_05915 [Streptomyces sp. NPDC005071]